MLARNRVMRIAHLPKSLMLGLSSAALLTTGLPALAAADKTKACVESLWPGAKSAGVTRATFALSLDFVRGTNAAPQKSQFLERQRLDK